MTPTRFVCRNPAGDPVDDLLSCQAALRAANWWTRAELTEAWPLTTEQAAQLLAVGGEFDVDVEDLEDLVARRLLARPATGEGDQLEWSAQDILGASLVLQWREQWRPTPSGHDPYKHPCELVFEQARATDQLQQLVTGSDGIRYDARHLLRTLVLCDAQEGRRQIATLLRAVLQVDHGITI